MVSQVDPRARMEALHRVDVEQPAGRVRRPGLVVGLLEPEDARPRQQVAPHGDGRPVDLRREKAAWAGHEAIAVPPPRSTRRPPWCRSSRRRRRRASSAPRLGRIPSRWPTAGLRRSAARPKRWGWTSAPPMSSPGTARVRSASAGGTSRPLYACVQAVRHGIGSRLPARPATHRDAGGPAAGVFDDREPHRAGREVAGRRQQELRPHGVGRGSGERRR